MEERKRVVVYSNTFIEDIGAIYEYGLITFGVTQAISYEDSIWQLSSALNTSFLMYPECRHIPTKNRIYRNIILDSHLIIYRIRAKRIEVLRVVHSSISIINIKESRSVKM